MIFHVYCLVSPSVYIQTDMHVEAANTTFDMTARSLTQMARFVRSCLVFQFYGYRNMLSLMIETKNAMQKIQTIPSFPLSPIHIASVRCYPGLSVHQSSVSRQKVNKKQTLHTLFNTRRLAATPTKAPQPHPSPQSRHLHPDPKPHDAQISAASSHQPPRRQ